MARDRETLRSDTGQTDPRAVNHFLESRRLFVIVGVTLLCVAMLVVMSMRNSVDYDEFWHLKMGQDWMQKGLSPWVDHYSFTFLGESIINPPVLFQVLLAGLVDTLGEYEGLVAIKVIAFLLTLTLMVAWLHQLRAPAVVFLAVLPILVVVLQFRTQVRPELFSFALMVAAFMLYRRTQLRLSFSAIAPVAALLALWSAYHSSILGYVIFFGLFVDIAVRLLREHAKPTEWLKWSGWGLVLVAVGFVNVSLSHPLLAMLQFPEEWRSYILEYRVPTNYLQYFSTYLMLLCAASTLLLSLILRRFGYVIVLAVMSYAALTTARMVTPAMIVILLMFADVFSEWLRPLRAPKQPVRFQTPMIFFLIFMAGLSLFQGVRATRGFLAENKHSWTRFPTALVNHYEDAGRTGNIFNEYEMGGYLLYRLAPKSKVYIDGRTGILYPLEHYENLLKAKASSEFFLAEAERHDIASSVLQASGDNASLMHYAGWSLEFLDIEYALFTPGTGALDVMGFVWARPECFSTVDTAELAREMAPYQDPERTASAMNPLLRVVAAFPIVQDQSVLLRQALQVLGFEDDGLRFLAHAALEIGDPSLVLSALDRVKQNVPVDDVTRVRAHLMMGEERKALQTLVAALDYPWRTILLDEQRLQLWAIDEVQSASGTDPRLVAHRERLLQTLKTNGGSPPQPLDPVGFCEA